MGWRHEKSDKVSSKYLTRISYSSRRVKKCVVLKVLDKREIGDGLYEMGKLSQENKFLEQSFYSDN